MKEEGMKGGKRACQIKGMLRLDNEALEVNMSVVSVRDSV